jgi:transposase-like protein
LLKQPLCRSYALGAFQLVAVRVRDAEGVREVAMRWGWGWLADGECEPLGAWLGSSLVGVFADLKSRGVERIWHVTGTDAGLSCGPPSAELGDSALCIDRLFGEGPAGSRWDTWGASALAVEQVRDGLVRAIRRHGCFDSEAAVLDFMAGALQRTERRLDRGMIAKGRTRQATGAQLGAPGI